MTNFDERVDRTKTPCEKWDKYKDKDVIPAWVADMDFKSPPCVMEALQKRVSEGVFGYTAIDDETYDAILAFIKCHYNWEIQKEWLVFTHGVVSSMNIACMAVEGESVMTTTPIYPHFIKAPKHAGREVIAIKMKEENKRWTLDFKAMEAHITPTCKLFMLCNPYNPAGTVFTCNELEQLGAFCLKHNLSICSDEIHADLILNDTAKHIPIASLSPSLQECTITLMAPSKTFNIAGLQASFAIIPNVKLRQKFKTIMGSMVGGVNLLGIVAMKAAYLDGDAWLRELRLYLAHNLQMVQAFVAKNPTLKLLDQEATFLAWIDASALHVNNPYEFFLSFGVGLSDGEAFGDKNFIRLNFGTQKDLLEEILRRMQKAMDSLKI
ncbi:MalY/PatB family protein [Sulfurospirillum barnesii]|uniref:cysteine-S-conjugate beta-lyase n=1 Tax=Sulfurospirillum barnesii (strain ATCC 700032 / DSM 10660 / SES-3) TaxID=760154 RepID=I3XXX1_SULBS|nr:PatB family C-S lyase [Sulfurospirillum barnesii]AFL68795.1 bifunctional PLP-dependent enzyme with beta-cystathionase and maltose regulon repressor activities [Sulfurospirillum barnesii SES-3]